MRYPNLPRLLIVPLILATSVLPSTLLSAEQSPQPLTVSQRASLLSVDAHGGTVIRLRSFNLQSPDSKWQFQPAANFTFHPADANNPAHWSFNRETPGKLGRGLWSRESFELKPNRHYTVSALINSDFTRTHSELNCTLVWLDAQGKSLPGMRSIGFPAQTTGPNGWQRFEAEFISPSSDVLAKGRFGFWFFLGQESEQPLHFQIADIALIESPPTQTAAVKNPVAEVTFPGGPGHLPMRIESVEATASGSFKIRVSGVTWEVRPQTGEIIAEQRIGYQRELARFTLKSSLAGLKVARQDATVAVLVNDAVALGFQCDGMLAICPLKTSRLIATSALNGGFVRCGDGHLLASDGRGGFTVNPYPTRGGGQMARSQPLTLGLDFVGFARDDLQSLSKAPAGWQIAWELDVGERVFLSAFPPREYPWAQSFATTWMLSGRDWNPAKDYQNDHWRNVFTWLLWDFHQREWGMSFGTKFIPHDPAQIQAHVAAVHAMDKRAIFYTSAWFFCSRDPQTYADAVMEQVDTFGFDGFYTDGLPAIEWLTGYIELRMLRERLDAGGRERLIYVHDSVPQSGRHAAAWMPWLYTYADVHYMAEGVASNAGTNWNWVRYIISGNQSTNSIGTIKGDEWKGPEFHREIDKWMAGLVWNARIGEAGRSGHNETYIPILKKLEAEWKAHDNDPQFYERYYLPKAHELTGF